jgi:hypothetical protein
MLAKDGCFGFTVVACIAAVAIAGETKDIPPPDEE